MEEEERAGRAVNSEEAAKLPSLRQRMDIDDSDIIITGATNTRISRQQVMVVNGLVLSHCPHQLQSCLPGNVDVPLFCT